MSAETSIRPEDVEERAEEAAAFLRALAHPMRLRLVCELLQGERGVGELEQLTSIRQPSLSKELGKLREAGLIEGRRESKAVFYSLVDDRASAVLSALCGDMQAAPQKNPARPRAAGNGTNAPTDKGSVFARILPPQD
jgi:DNA-binding transcriptional ArsR family regulator